MSYLTPPLQIFQNSPMKITVVFLDDNNNPFDPASGIQISVEDPAGTVTTYTYAAQEVEKESVGNYSVVVEATLAGDYQAVGQGALPDGKLVTTKGVQNVTPTTFT
jgi:hypothetical protein